MARSPTRDFSDVEQRAWAGFLAVHSRVTRELDALLGAEHAMPLVEYEVLLKLSAAGGALRMSELADVAFLSRSGLTRIVNELEALGLVARVPDAGDGRVLLATLTARGRRRFAAARSSHLAHVRELFLDNLSRGQQAQMAGCWERILGGLERDSAGARPSRSRRRTGASTAARPRAARSSRS